MTKSIEKKNKIRAALASVTPRDGSPVRTSDSILPCYREMLYFQTNGGDNIALKVLATGSAINGVIYTTHDATEKMSRLGVDVSMVQLDRYQAQILSHELDSWNPIKAILASLGLFLADIAKEIGVDVVELESWKSGTTDAPRSAYDSLVATYHKTRAPHPANACLFQ